MERAMEEEQKKDWPNETFTRTGHYGCKTQKE
jgi:hypothetical protein